MTDDQWQRRMEIFDAACDLPEDERDAYLEDACGDDEALLESVRRLLAQADKDESLHIVSEAAADLVTSHDMSGTMLGHYRIVEKIGAGGMGDVYRGERADGEYDQQVAIKLMHGGAQSEQMIERFRAERQILAQLSHPNVAQLIDGGVSEQGQPYFVMEYVDGLPLDQFCDENALTIEERLNLFRDVCRAVSYAHANLVVHRDLKPSNIFVTESGQVKLLDFGIARVMSEEENQAKLTRTGLSVMTPSYASPEQALGQPITTATDVYSLGVNLYELMSGCRPYDVDSTNPVQAAEIIAGVKPKQPSTAFSQGNSGQTAADIARARGTFDHQLKRQLSGDIDMICAKAMHKEPDRRYVSALALAEDIDRHLGHLPIQARPDAFSYRAGRFLRRHRAAAMATVVVVAIISGLVGTYTWQLAAANKESEAIAGFLQEIILSPTPGKDGVGGSVLDVLENASRRIESEFEDQPRVRAEIHSILGYSYVHMQRYAEAEEQALKAYTLSKQLYGDSHEKTRATRHTLMAARYAPNQKRDISDLIAEQQRTAPATPDVHEIQLHSILGAIAWRDGDLEQSLIHAETAHKLSEQILDEDDRARIVATHNYGRRLSDANRFDEAEQILREAIRLTEISDYPDLRSDARMDLASVYYMLGDYETAMEIYQESLDFAIEARGQVNVYTAMINDNIGMSLAALGRYDEAVERFEQSLVWKLELHGETDPRSTGTMRLIGKHGSRGDMDKGRPYFERALQGAMSFWPDGHFQIGVIYNSYSATLYREGLYAEAVEKALLARQAFERNPSPYPDDLTSNTHLLKDSYEALGDMQQMEVWAVKLAELEAGE